MRRLIYCYQTNFDKPIKKTSIGRRHSRIKFSSMNKNKKASYKKYRGQGK